MSSRFLPVREFCARYGVGRTTAYALLQSGSIEAVRVGARTLIDAESAEAWAASLPRFKSAAALARATEAT